MINQIDDEGRHVVCLDEIDIRRLLREKYRASNPKFFCNKIGGVEHYPVEIKTLEQRELVTPSLLQIRVTLDHG
jgi:hypothetical protein